MKGSCQNPLEIYNNNNNNNKVMLQTFAIESGIQLRDSHRVSEQTPWAMFRQLKFKLSQVFPISRL